MITITLLIAAQSAFAQDNGIRTVTYDRDAVIPIYTEVGIPTLIQFETGEALTKEDGVLGMGDANAWTLGVKNNNILMKPKVYKPDTKMLVVTNRRTYVFDIKSVKKKEEIQPTLLLRFDYPDSRALLAEKEVDRKSKLEERMARISVLAGSAENTNYVQRGDAALAPTEVYDNGEFTYLRFNNNRDLPMVFKVMPDGSEALVNTHYDQENSTLIIHEVSREFILRLGSSVMALRNNGYDPDGKANTSGTTIENAVRIQKGEV